MTLVDAPAAPAAPAPSAPAAAAAPPTPPTPPASCGGTWPRRPSLMAGPTGLASSQFRAMGSDVHIIVVGEDAAAHVEWARWRIAELEQKWSRFIETSEVSQLNRRAGQFVSVSAETVTLVEQAQQAWRLSGGAFDPTLLGAVIRAGYDRSFELLGPAPAPGQSYLGPGAAGIEVVGREVRLPAGVGFDPGGIGKGLAADVVCGELMASGAGGACINMGGDVRVAGTAPGGGPWTVGVEHPWSDEPLALVGLVEGAVATSTTLRRRWHTGGRAHHHLIDPQTGRPSETDVNLATVVASDAWIAEVLAKTVLLKGSSHPFDILGGTMAEGLVVDDTGRVQASSGWPAYVGGIPVPATIDR